MMRGYKTPPPPKIYFLLDFLFLIASVLLFFSFPLAPTISPPLCHQSLSLPTILASDYQFYSFSTYLPWHRKCYATDIKMMMPWI